MDFHKEKGVVSVLTNKIACEVCGTRTRPKNMERHKEVSEKHHYRLRCIERKRLKL